jgi:hypothetical protein
MPSTLALPNSRLRGLNASRLLSGLTTPPHPDSLTPERRAECARLTEAILAYQQRRAERQRIAERPHADLSPLQAGSTRAAPVPRSGQTAPNR